MEAQTRMGVPAWVGSKENVHCPKGGPAGLWMDPVSPAGVRCERAGKGMDQRF